MMPPTLDLSLPGFFLEELSLLMGQFEAAETMDDWDMARLVFEALVQNAWSAHVILTADSPLRCPVLPLELHPEGE